MNKDRMVILLAFLLIATGGGAIRIEAQEVGVLVDEEILIEDPPPGAPTREYLERRRAALSAAAAEDAEPDPPAEPEQPVKDYGSGFEMFYKLGLPRTGADARYVTLQAYGQGMSVHGGRNISGMWDLELKGNAWIIEDLPDDAVRAVLFSGRTVDVTDQRKLHKRMQERMRDMEDPREAMGMEERLLGGTWTEADPAQDMAAIRTYLQKKKAEARRYRHSSMEAGYGELFLAMASFHAAGHADGANRVVHELFNMGNDPRRIILAGLNKLADSQYDAAYADFQRDRDWNAFHKTLADLLARFKTGWRMAPAVQMLAERVRARAEGPSTPVPGLTEADQALADSLLDPQVRRAQRHRPGGQLWTLAPPALPESDDKTPPHPIDSILARGTEAVPFLIALLDDTALSSIAASDLDGGHHYSHHHFSSSGRSGDTLTEEQVLALYRQMSRPVSRGEIARRLLDPLPIVPGDASRGGRRQALDTEDFKVEIKAWHEKHKALAPAALAKVYLESGNDVQKNAAVPLLTESDAEEDQAAVERFFISRLEIAHRHGRNPRQVEDYVFRRGAEAENFVDRYADAWSASLARTESDDDTAAFSHQEHLVKQMEQHLKQLRLLAAARPPETLLAELLAGEADADDTLPLLHRHLRSMPFDQALTMLLPPLAQTRSSALTDTLFGLLQATGNRRHMPYGGAAPQVLPPAETHADLWRPLIEDATVHQPGGNAKNWRVAEIMEILYGGHEHYYMRRQTAALWGDRRQTLMLARARARLDGEPADQLPEFPNADTVDATARTALKQRLTAAAEPEARTAILTGLSDAEELAVSEMLAEDNDFNRALQSATLVVAAIEAHVGQADLAARANAFKNRTWSRDLILDLHQWAQALAQSGQRTRIYLGKPVGVSGLTLRIDSIPAESERVHPFAEQTGAGRRPAATRALLRTRGVSAQIDWRDGAAPPAESGSAPDAPVDLLDMMAEELETDMERRTSEQEKIYWAAVVAHPADAWPADSGLEAVFETYPIEE